MIETMFNKFVGWLLTPSVVVANVALAQDGFLTNIKDWLITNGINQIITIVLGILIILYWSGKLYEMYCRHWRPERYKKIKKDV